MPSKVGATHSPRRAWRRWACCSAASGSATLAQVADHLAQPWWVQPPGGLQQHRLGCRHGPSGEILRTAGQRGGVLVAELPLGEGLGGAGEGAAVQGSGDADALVGVGVAHAGAIAEPAGGGLGGGVLVGAGGAAAVHPGQLPQPVAFQPLEQRPKHQHPPGRLRVAQAVQILGGQLADNYGQVVEPPSRWHRIYVRIHVRNLSHPAPSTRAKRQSVYNFLDRVQSLGIQGRESKRNGYCDCAMWPQGGREVLVAQTLADRLSVHHVDFDWALRGAGRSTA
jgi:hypothetical protein